MKNFSAKYTLPNSFFFKKVLQGLNTKPLYLRGSCTLRFRMKGEHNMFDNLGNRHFRHKDQLLSKYISTSTQDIFLLIEKFANQQHRRNAELAEKFALSLIRLEAAINEQLLRIYLAMMEKNPSSGRYYESLIEISLSHEYIGKIMQLKKARNVFAHSFDFCAALWHYTKDDFQRLITLRDVLVSILNVLGEYTGHVYV